MSKRSPGPWPTRESATHVTVTNARGDAVFHDDKRIPGVMVDARLIAAAPELLEALADAVIDFDNWAAHEDNHPHEHLVAWVEKARAAIAKAKGEEQ